MPAKIEQLIEDFWSPSGRDSAYQSLIDVIGNEAVSSKNEAISFLLSVIPCLEDKTRAWKTLQGILNSKNRSLITDILRSFGPIFKDLPDKSEAWQELHKLTLSRDIWIKEYAAFAIGPAFAYIPEKFQEQAMKDLFRLARNSHEEVQESVAMSIEFAFPYLPDRSKAWDILVNMALEDDCDVGHAAAVSFKSAFPYVSEKIEAWEELLYIVNYESFFTSYETTYSLFSSYSFYPDKLSGYHDLIQLLTHENRDIRNAAAISIGHIFQYFPDKVLAQRDLMSLLNDEEFDFKGRLIISIGNAFSSLPDKEGAWHILHQCVKSDDESIRKGVAFSIGDACPDLPFPEKSLSDLLILAQDKNDSVRMGVAHSLGFIYPHVDDDCEILDCLMILAEDNDAYVRNRANYSLGKINVYNASKTKDEVILESLVEKAVVYFEKAAIEECYFNPAKFCSLFYRSFSEVIFKKQIHREEIEKYIVDAKSIAKDSTNKKRLIKVVENLSEVLFSAQSFHKIGINSKVDLVTYCRKQCDSAEYLMDKTKGTAPNLNQLFHNVKPLFDRKVKELIENIKETSETACKESKGTRYECLACNIKEETAGWGGINDEIISIQIERFIKTANKHMPPQEVESIRSEFENIKAEKNVTKLISTMVDDIFSILEYAKKSSEFESLKSDLVEVKKMLEPSIRQEFVVTSGFTMLGTGGQLVTSYPVKSIPKSEVKETVQDKKKTIAGYFGKVTKSKDTKYTEY